MAILEEANAILVVFKDMVCLNTALMAEQKLQ